MWNKPGVEGRPGGNDFRYIPSPSITRINETGAEKHMLAWKQHCAILNDLRAINCYEMKSLDTVIDTTEGAIDLRTGLMQLLASDGKKLLHSVDICHKFQDPFQQRKVLTVRSKNYDEMNNMVKMLPLLFTME